MHRPFKKQKTSARRNAEDVDSGASGSMMTSPTDINFGGSSPSSSEANNRASSSSTAPTEHCYEVFLSFRGLDTRDGFASHLYKGLLNAGIRAFRDDNELRDGESIGQDLEAAITNSKILIPILSVNYGTSSWCLNELVQMMDGKNNNGQMVLPIFYKVKPADVGHQIGSFGDAFHARERRLRERPPFDPTIVENWKKALAEVSGLKGDEADGDEAKVVESIVKKVLRELKKKFELVISENLVGIDSPVKEVMEFVNNKSNVTLFVGIYGMGGIGKTTLAKAIYNKLFNQFEHHSFIADVRESSNQGVNYLQKQLLRDILQLRENEVFNKDEGANLISSRCKGKKVIILLDDVDNVVQLKYLAGKRDWFFLGSVIIITTRNLKILEQFGVDITYEHKGMDDVNSLILFSKHAFRRDSPPREFEDLARKVVSTTGGLPLSLQILGSLLCGVKQELFWRDTIDKLKEVPPKDVQKTLKISYEALDYYQKKIFLDIACFFIGTDSRIASYMWKACNFFPAEGIEVLRFMSLIKIEDDHKLRMHDHLRDLGRMIVREEDEQPWHRSRLWIPEDALKALKRNKRMDEIEAINLSKGSSEGFAVTAERDDNIYIEKQFKNVTHLRFLNLEGANLRGDFEDSMTELKWLRWPNCPMNFEAKNLHVKELAVLELSFSKIDGKWEGWSSFTMAKKLKFLDLSYCYSLENTHFLSAFENLEVLILTYCKGLQRIDSSIEDMEALRRLDLSLCIGLMELPTEIGKLKALEQLHLRNTVALSSLPDSIGSLENLEILDISYSGIQRLPERIGRLRKLRKLHAYHCENLRGEMPESMSNLSSLQHLDFLFCKEVQSLPNFPSSLTHLEVTCQSHKLPSLSHLTRLKRLVVWHCKSLECIQELPSALIKNPECSQRTDGEESELPQSLTTPFKLEYLTITSCESIINLDLSQFIHLRVLCTDLCKNLREVRGLDKLIYLESLRVRWCGSIERLDLPKCEDLKLLDVRACRNLVEFKDFDRLQFLEGLNISKCSSIKRLDLLNTMRLKDLDVRDCKNLAKIQGLDRLELLESLNISRCTLIEELDLSKFRRLKELTAKKYKNFDTIQGLDRLEFLESLDISGCTSVERLNLLKLRSLKILCAKSCKKLAKIQGLDRLEFLELLNIEKCISIERLDLPKSGRLMVLQIAGCENLTEIQDLDGLDFLERLDIFWCTSIKRLDLPKSGRLKELDATGCKNLAKIQGLDRLKSLRDLMIHGCSSIERLDLPKSNSLEVICAASCKILAEIRLNRLKFLELLLISGCTLIERLDLSKSRRMRVIDARDCENLSQVQGLDRLEVLESLEISGCTSIERLDLPNSRSLKIVYAESCKKLAEIRGLDRLELLEELNVAGCNLIKRLNLPNFGKLKQLDAGDCENLVEIQGLDRLEFLERLRIIGCKSLQIGLELYRPCIYQEKLFEMTKLESESWDDSDEQYTGNDSQFSNEDT